MLQYIHVSIYSRMHVNEPKRTKLINRLRTTVSNIWFPLRKARRFLKYNGGSSSSSFSCDTTSISRLRTLMEITDTKNSWFGNTYGHSGMKLKRDHVVLSLNFKKGPTAISMATSCRPLYIMAACGPIWKTSENTTTTWFRFTFTPKWVGFPQTWIIFISDLQFQIRTILSKFIYWDSSPTIRPRHPPCKTEDPSTTLKTKPHRFFLS